MVPAFLGLSARLQANVMSFKRNQILSPGGVIRACKFVLAFLLPPTVAAICPATLEVALADEPPTTQQQSPTESHDAEQDQQREPGSSPAAPPAAPDSLCDVLAKAAASHDLPADFFTRLIWQESRFKADAISRAGAQGVA